MVKGNPYWYLVQSVRVNGKPRPKIVAYLGSQANFVAKLLTMYGPEAGDKTELVNPSTSTTSSLPAIFQSKAYGAVAALHATAKELHLPLILSQHLSSQIRGGLSVAEVILAGAIHRALSTGSKSDFTAFASKTYLPELMSFDPQDLTSQCFWDQMNTVTEEQILQIEQSVTQEILKQYKPSLDVLFYDTTNFFTFIDTHNTKSTLSQRGHNKQKRNDLRQFSLALLTLREFFLPIGSHVYEGNINDVSHCPSDIHHRMKQLQRLIHLPEELEDITFVFDKGGYTKESIANLAADQIHFVTSLSACYQLDLIREAYAKPENWIEVSLGSKTKTTNTKTTGDTEPESLSVYRTDTTQWGVPVMVLLYESPTLLLSQVEELEKSLVSLTEELQQLKESTESRCLKQILQKKDKKTNNDQMKTKKGKPTDLKPTEDLFVKTVKQTLGKLQEKPLASLFHINLEIKGDGWMTISWELDPTAKAKWIQERLGKIVLMTNQRQWSSQEIIEVYRGQNHIEQLFRHLKNPHFHAVRPVYHWTDQKIKVHVLICLLGFLLAQLTWVKTKQAGINLSLNEMLQKLQSIRKGKSIQPGKKQGSLKIEEYIERIDPEDTATQSLFTLLFPQETCPISKQI